MFTGIITAIGTVREIVAADAARDLRLTIGTSWDTAAIGIGASIALNGACMTVIARHGDGFEVEVSSESLAKTAIGTWTIGTPINLERPLCLGDEFGGHLVSGHVDGTAALVARHSEHGSLRLRFEAPRAIGRFIAEKGSVAVDGVSLTVNAVADLAQVTEFAVNIIPHTARATNLGALAVGSRVHLEIDLLARYVARIHEARADQEPP